MMRDTTGEGPVRQAFRGALRQELSDLYRLMATLEAQAAKPLPTALSPTPGDHEVPGADIALTLGALLHRAGKLKCLVADTPPYLTLRRLLVWLGDPLVRLRWLASVADGVASLNGGQLLAVLEGRASAQCMQIWTLETL